MQDEDIQVSPTLSIPATELSYQFSRSGGAGGQNVNKVSTRAELRWDLGATEALPPDVKARLTVLAASWLTKDGVIRLVSQIYRDQPRNIEAVRERLANLVRAALVVPRERRPTRPSAGSKRRRLEGKKVRSDIKQNRTFRGDDG